MRADWLSGVWVAMPTPWTAAGRVDAGLVHELLRRYAAEALDGAYTTGTDGEMHVMEMPHFRDLVDAFASGAEQVGLPVQIGCTWSSTEGVLERVRYARECGVTCVQVALPSWIPLNDAELLRFYEAIQRAAPEIAIVHYNIARSGRMLTGRDYQAILEVSPNLCGSKHTGGDFGALIEIVEATPDLSHFVVDSQIVMGALFGAQGFYSFIANLSPTFAREIWRLTEERQWEDAARLAKQGTLLFQDWFAAFRVRPGSPALAKIATAAGILPEMPLAVREPYLGGTPDDVATLRRLVDEQFSEWRYDESGARV